MDDPGKLIEDGMAETNQVLALQASVREGQRLLSIAIGQRNMLSARNTAMWMLLRRVKRRWIFRFLPKELKQEIETECGRAD